MHLKHIKLAGFKSFAEPTQIPVPGQLVGVVGPNGCGKSNVIDAVRWVLGESQAKHLRGETLQDVIFGGTAERKALGRASVELVFDNSDGRAPGQWAAYAELAVRRVLARDGVSSYYINNTHVRRRDVQDMFMGTGLGPRAYAIIEQGMISRIVESKPEEIRVFLEEAAGISRYKERRRETELRLNDTRGHLSRTSDIRLELGNQIEKLEGQAVVAQQYREFQAQLLEAQNLLLLSRKRDAEAARARAQRELEKIQIELEAEIARMREVESSIELQRQQHYVLSDALNLAQGVVYQANSEVTRIENQLQTLRAERRRLEGETAALRQEIAADEAGLQADQGALIQHKSEQARAQELVRVGTLRVAQEQEALPRTEGMAAERRQALDELRQTQGQLESILGVARAGQANAERLLVQLSERGARLKDEQSRMVAPDSQQLALQDADLSERQVRGTALNAAQQALAARVKQFEVETSAARSHAEAMRHEAARIEAELNALVALQSKLSVNERARELVNQHGLAKLPVFWQGIEVRAGWELAVEAALGQRLNAFRIEGFEAVSKWTKDEMPAGVALFSAQSAAPHSKAVLPKLPGNPVALSDLVTIRTTACEGALSAWMSNVWCVDNLANAISSMNRLPEGVTLVTPEGHRVTHEAVLFFTPQGESHGALTRAREIEEHRVALAELGRNVAHAEDLHHQAELALTQCREDLNHAQREGREAEAARHAVEVDRTRLAGELNRYQQRSEQITAELSELAQQLGAEQAVLQAAKDSQTQTGAQLTERAKQLEVAQTAWGEADRTRDAARTSLQSSERSLQEAIYLEKTASAAITHVKTQQQAAEQRLEQRRPRLVKLIADLEQCTEDNLAALLQNALGARAQAESALTDARVTLDNAGAALREQEEKRLQIEQGLEPLRNRMGDVRLKEQEARLNVERATETLLENHADEVALTLLMEKGTRTSTLQAEINQLTQDIEALGAVNLAALAELEASRERKNWLDAQTADLEAAVATLEEAMHKIDRETREQLKETFERVNASFSTLFPTLFGGGHARIELTGDEILDAGVQIIAQPPGKKTTSIHLLSGGEKALTALSLVFALFQLNPAPFCLLDEVDAPLDDANTERFVRLVKKMSEQTQFLFITHNKIAMEMAQQLVGITMAESGVSRMVAVDIEEAIRLTEIVAA